MRSSSAPSTIPNGPQSKTDSDEVIVLQGSDTPPREQEIDPRRTPKEALVDFEGNVRVVRADRIWRLCWTKTCIQFSAHCLALLTAVILGLVMMVLNQGNSMLFGVWSGIFSLGIGGFLPNPRIKSDGASESGADAPAGVPNE